MLNSIQFYVNMGRVDNFNRGTEAKSEKPY